MKLEGVEALLKDMRAFGPSVSKKAADQGVKKAGAYLRKQFRAAAPRRSGLLRKSITMKYYRKSGKLWVGLRKNAYYKTLEYGREGTGPMHPFFEKTWNAHRRHAAQMIIKSARRALYEEAGKVYAKSKTRRKR
jgi:HK97 gp10 family phage protein